MSDDVFMLRASLGQCFRWQNDMSCPLPCSDFTSCGSCLVRPECGWCSSGSAGSGNGSCIRGDALGPDDANENGSCIREDLSSGIILAHEATDTGWAFFSCPNIDDCRFTVDGDPLTSSPCPSTAACVDNVSTTQPGRASIPSYTCSCRSGYTGDGDTCTPLCDQFGCSSENGNCTAPDMCTCDTGWTTANCSQDCGCNGHCDCSNGSTAITCLDFTTGPSCEFCAAGYYGDALDNGVCTECLLACNGLSENCELRPVPNTNVSTVWCLNCLEHSAGQFCDECVAEYAQSVSGHCYERTSVAEFPAPTVAGAAGPAEGVALNFDPGRWALARAIATPVRLSADNGFRHGIAIDAPDSATGSRGRNLLLAVFSSRWLSALELNVTVVDGNTTRQVLPQLVSVPAYELLQVVVSCAAADFFNARTFIEFETDVVTLDLSFAVLWGPNRNVHCAVCSDCRTPCIAGLYQQPERRNQCVSCECNGHGNVCDVRTGGFCGVLAAGCTGLSSANCNCAHGTASLNTTVATEQCNRCRDNFPAHVADNDERGRLEYPQRPCYNFLTLM
jgi:hypothetical protein